MGLGIKTKIFNILSKRAVDKIAKTPLSASGLNSGSTRSPKVTVSLTSYPPRMDKIHLCIKSLLMQEVKPDRVILYLGTDTSAECITPQLRELEKYGLTIKTDRENIKPHKKYYYAFSEYPDDIIITADDDVVYTKDMVGSLLESYKKHPDCVSARRAHKMRFDKNKKLIPYRDWIFQCREFDRESMLYFPTGIGGVLYPPGILDKNWSDIESIKSLCLNADDVWLKFMQILADVPAVIVKSSHPHPYPLEENQTSALNLDNVLENSNDKYINNLIEKYNIDMSELIGR